MDSAGSIKRFATVSDRCARTLGPEDYFADFTRDAIAVPTSEHFAVPPRSYVRTFPAFRTLTTAASTPAPASWSARSFRRRPSQSSIIWTARIIAIGFTSSFPVCFGLDPWIGSNIPCASPMFPPPALPTPPRSTAAKSVAPSPGEPATPAAGEEPAGGGVQSFRVLPHDHEVHLPGLPHLLEPVVDLVADVRVQFRGPHVRVQVEPEPEAEDHARPR